MCTRLVQANMFDCDTLTLNYGFFSVRNNVFSCCHCCRQLRDVRFFWIEQCETERFFEWWSIKFLTSHHRMLARYSLTLALVYVIQMLNKQMIHGDVKLFAHQTNFQMENALRLQFRYFDQWEWARTRKIERCVEQESGGSQASNNIECSIGPRKNTVPST